MAPVTRTFECEIQARLRDINLGGHVDNVEAMRVVDEARLLFFRFAPLEDDAAHGRPGLLREVPSGVVELMGSQRVDYRAEMRFVAYQPFLVSIRVSHVGRSSFAIASELRVAPDHPPALIAESSLVLWDTAAGAAWPIADDVRATLAAYTGEPAALRPRPGDAGA